VPFTEDYIYLLQNTNAKIAVFNGDRLDCMQSFFVVRESEQVQYKYNNLDDAEEESVPV